MKTLLNALAAMTVGGGGLAVYDSLTPRDVSDEPACVVVAFYTPPDEHTGRDAYRMTVETADGRLFDKVPADRKLIGVAKRGLEVRLKHRRSRLGVVAYDHVTP